MSEPRFLQIHCIIPFTAALLNRDDSGLAKRLAFGDVMRTRISSQCLKRNWRICEDTHSLANLPLATEAYRSREIVDRKVLAGLTHGVDKEVVSIIRDALLIGVYGDKGTSKKSRQPLLLGEVEINYLRDETKKLIENAKGDEHTAKTLTAAWIKEHKANFTAFSKSTKIPAGLIGALFGRMVTSDPRANIDAPVHVAHAFTVHAEEAESDYFVSIDDLAREEEPSADMVQESELTSGLFYSYVVVDMRGLIDNLGGNRDLAGKVLHNLIYLIAETTPGAKRGSTAPYSRASFMLIEAGDRQPRTLAEAFRKPAKPTLDSAVEKLANYLEKLDSVYATGEKRHFISLADIDIPGAKRGNLKDMADFVEALPQMLPEKEAA